MNKTSQTLTAFNMQTRKFILLRIFDSWTFDLYIWLNRKEFIKWMEIGVSAKKWIPEKLQQKTRLQPLSVRRRPVSLAKRGRLARIRALLEGGHQQRPSSLFPSHLSPATRASHLLACNIDQANRSLVHDLPVECRDSSGLCGRWKREGSLAGVASGTCDPQKPTK